MTRKRTYLAAICHGTGGYGVVFRDFPGCTSMGDSIEDALTMGREALQGHLAVMQEYGDPIPEPTQHTLTDVADWLYEPEDESGEEWIGFYPVDVELDGRRDVHIDLPRSLIRDLEKATPDSRQFIIEVARRELDRLKNSA